MTYGDSTIYVFELDPNTGGIIPSHTTLKPGLRNPYNFVRHQETGNLFVLYSGAPRGVGAGVQQVIEADDGTVSLGMF